MAASAIIELMFTLRYSGQYFASVFVRKIQDWVQDTEKEQIFPFYLLFSVNSIPGLLLQTLILPCESTGKGMFIRRYFSGESAPKIHAFPRRFFLNVDFINLAAVLGASAVQHGKN